MRLVNLFEERPSFGVLCATKTATENKQINKTYKKETNNDKLSYTDDRRHRYSQNNFQHPVFFSSILGSAIRCIFQMSFIFHFRLKLCHHQYINKKGFIW